MNTNEPKAKIYTIKQAATVIEGLTEYRIRQMCRSGELPYIKAGKKYLVSEYALMDLIFSPFGEKTADKR